MHKFNSFADFSKNFLVESIDFDTNLQKDPESVEQGDQVFHMGKWQNVTEIRPDGVAVTDDNNKISVIRNSDITNRGLLTKIATAENNVKVDEPGKLPFED